MSAELVAQMPGELADRRRLAGAVNADGDDHRRLTADVDPTLTDTRRLGEQLDQPLAEHLAALEAAFADFRFERRDDRRRRAGADVRHDQRLLEPFPGVLVEHTEQRRLDLRAERLARLRHALAQTPEEAAFALRARSARRLGAIGDGLALVALGRRR